MKHIFALAAGLLITLTASAQSNDMGKVMESRHQERVLMREARHKAEILEMDSIVLSRYYRFIPMSFQQQPAGNMRNIYGIQYSLMMYKDYMDIDIPYLMGITAPYRLTILNYITFDVKKYTAIQNDEGWTITFQSGLYSVNTYTFTLQIYSITREAVLNIASDQYPTVTYYGTLQKIY